MKPKANLKPAQFARFAEAQHRRTEGTIRRKIVRRGQHAAKILRKWLYASKHNVTGEMANFPQSLTHEEFIQASHLAFLAHDDAYHKFFTSIRDPRWKNKLGRLSREHFRTMVEMNIKQYNLSPGVVHLLTESRMVQDDFAKVEQATERLQELKELPETEETRREAGALKSTISEIRAYIQKQHPAVIVFNAAQAQSYFIQRRGAQKFNRLGVVHWPPAALALYGPYLEKGGMKEEGEKLTASALAKAYPGLRQHIHGVLNQYRDDIKKKIKQWTGVAQTAIDAALAADRERVLRGETALYPDLADVKYAIEPLEEKSEASLYRTFTSKKPADEQHHRYLEGVHDIVRSRIIVDEDDEEKAVRACRQIWDAVKNHLDSPAFPLEQVEMRHDRLEAPKKNKFRSLILALHFKGYPAGTQGLPRAELQILSRAMHRQNERPQSARVPRWRYFDAILPKRRIKTLLGITRNTKKNKAA